jgi:CheY-like chemotaxis protein
MQEDVTISQEVGRGIESGRVHDASAPRPDGPSRGERAQRHDVVLIVDDESCLRAVLAELLEGAGYQVIEAENGADALHVMQRERPTVVLTDYTMPGLDGPGLIRRLRTQPATRHIPIIAMSATRPSRESLGDVPFIEKPFDVDEVLETIGRHIPDPSARDVAQASPTAH